MKPERSNWSSPPESLTLSDGEVHIWRIGLSQPASRVEKFLATLVPDERRRAHRFHFAKDYTHFVVARGFLRSILSGYLKATPQELRFCYGPYGKPALGGEQQSSGVRFNMSHSNHLALYAVTRQREIGVDIEHIRTNFASEEIAGLFFSPSEVAVLRTLSSDTQLAAFFKCWTRKEAYIKATGRGLTLALDSFDVSLAPGEPAALLRNGEDPGEPARWFLYDLHVEDSGYEAAIATNGSVRQIRRWQGLT